MIFLLLAQIGRRWQAERRLNQASDSSGLEAAAQLDRDNGHYWAGWARQLESEGRSSLPGWLRAISVNPRHGEWWMEAALESEAAGDPGQAERQLLQAERFNRMWGPRWALACFYMRRGRKEEALKWAQAASARAFGDRTALFSLCREAGADDRRILNTIVGDQPGNLAAFVRDLAQRGSVELASASVERYLESRQRWPHRAGRAEEAQETVEMAIDTLLLRGLGAEADQVAQQLGKHEFWGYDSSAEAARPLNPDFRAPWTGRGFGWRHGELEGVEVRPATAGEGVRIAFSGRQAENMDVLAQAVHCALGGTWELSLEYRGRDLVPAGSGVSWRLEPFGGKGTAETLDERKPVWPETEWSVRRQRWRVSEGGGVFRLVLGVRRPVGQPRVEGELGFRRLVFRREGEASR